MNHSFRFPFVSYHSQMPSLYKVVLNIAAVNA
jgi:hypothetical protein